MMTVEIPSVTEDNPTDSARNCKQLFRKKGRSSDLPFFGVDVGWRFLREIITRDNERDHERKNQEESEDGCFCPFVADATSFSGGSTLESFAQQ